VEFLGIGYQEVLLVLVLMLVVVGPQRMPQVAYQIGRAVREMQKYARAVRDEFSDEWEYLDTQAKEIRGEVDSAGRDLAEVRRSLRAETAQMDEELKAATNDAQKALPEARPAGERTPSPLQKAASTTRPGPKSTVSTNGGPPKPLSLKPKETTKTAEAAPSEPAPAAAETPKPPAAKPPLVF
jgi:sec-independent protein translocase protein TatB